jgi:hypothetical protein
MRANFQGVAVGYELTSFVNGLLEDSLLCEAGDIHLEVCDSKTLEVNEAANLIRAIYESLQMDRNY